MERGGSEDGMDDETKTGGDARAGAHPDPTGRWPAPGSTRGGFTVNRSRLAYENPWLTVREDGVTRADGQPGLYGVVTPKNWALGVVPLFADGTVMLVGQHRYPHDAYSWEIPEGGGRIGHDPQAEIARELREEAGLTAAHWHPLGPVHPSNSVVDETGYLWLAEDLTLGEAAPDGDEVLKTRRVPLGEALAMATSGAIVDALSVVGLFRAAAFLAARGAHVPWPAWHAPPGPSDVLRRGS